jgi:site-specific DNA-methyltransferase (adenine-specific)/modification methylase
MKPYYEQDGIVIYHGDCRDVEIQNAGTICTDPPYGINYRSNHNSSRRGQWAKWIRDENFGGIANDDGALDLSWFLDYPTVMVCGGNFYPFPPTQCWIVWDKRDGIGPNDQADAEMMWTNLDRPTRLYRHLWSGLIRAGEENISRTDKLHPHQKPVGLGVFALGYAKATGTIYDPFMGSGSFLVAAKRMGLGAVGVDVEERYCEIAAKRLAQGALPLEMGA